MNRPVTVLSLFDGMACGMLAMIRAGMKIKHYIAYETDKYAIKTAKYNFPEIFECGDVFRANFEQYSGKIDYLIGGSPCTYWSVAQKNNRETAPSGIGWKLFMQYVRALREVQPQFFIYENNRSMSAEIQKAISDTFGFEPICINSALVSAQMRQRLYWVGERTDDGAYGKVDVTQPEDRNILLPDILDGVIDREKSRAVIASANRTTTREYFCKHQGQMTFEPVVFSKPHGFNKGGCKYEKAPTLTANGDYQHNHMVVEPVNYTADGKAQTLKAQYINTNVRNICCYTSTYGATGVAEPVNMTANGKAKCLRSTYHKNGIRDMVANSVDRRTCVAEAVRVGSFPRSDGELTDGQGFRIYSADSKAVTLKGCSGGKGGKTGLYAIPIEFVGNEPVRAVSGADGKAYDVYRVENGMIYIGDKPYPIRLSDGLYIIRKLTVPECMRLQTVPYWYRFPVHDTQAYKMLGNGWTIEVIAHIIRATQK